MHLRDLIATTAVANHPPPLFTLGAGHPLWTRGPDYSVWERAGYESGEDCWQTMCRGIADERDAPLVSWEIWDELLKAELIRRACYAHVLAKRRGRDRTPGDWQAQLSADLALCQSDSLHWVDHWGWIEDTHADDPDMRDAPLLTWPSQRALWIHLDTVYAEATAQSPVAEIWCKGRRLGVTWLVMNWATLHWLLEQRFSAKVGSRVFEEADNGEDTDSMMGKFRFIYARQPGHLRPDWPGRVRRGQPDKLVSGLALNRWKASKVTAQHTTSNFGRSKRTQIIVLDEFARIKPRIQEECRTSMRTVARLEIILSTPRGSTNRFAWEYRRRPDRFKLELPYTYDPRRDMGWYDAELLENGGTLTESEAEREHKCSLQGISGENIWTMPESCLYDDTDPEWVELGNPRARLPKVAGEDYGTGPALTTHHEGVVDWDAGIETARYGRLPRIWVDLALQWRRTPEHVIAAEIHDGRSDYTGSWAVYGDPAGKATGVEQRSSMGEIRAGGVPVVAAHEEMTGWAGISQRIELWQEMVRLGLIRVHRTRAALAWISYTRWRWAIPEGVRLEQLSKDKVRPQKDDSSHHGDAALYMLDGIIRYHQPRIPRERKPVRRTARKPGDVDSALKHFA